ncbi:MAG: Putative multidrug resistance protein MdtD [Paraeggerthella hongkongensis]|uniref:MFS transporter n=1 Tax=Paraeggerthella hominis TaxID=2897351 RepID=UPI001C1157C6|nr:MULTISPECIES: MFS transporter [Paraeggerthella]MBU5405353.1 MFS transporter [Paraeggerthella hongkongensis]MCD2432526.1 MFS transporter [Paraeggerthella hominis]
MQGKPLVLLLLVLYGAAFLAGFNENLVNMALVSIMADYGVDSVTAQWLVTGYMIVATVVVMCMAFLYRRFHLRTLFFAASALSFAGSAMGLVANGFEMLFAARLVQAVGTGIFIPLMMNTIVAVTPKNKLGTYLSIGGCTITFGPALAPVVCGALVTTFGWHSIFVVPMVAMAILFGLGLRFVKNLETSEAHLDVLSVVLAAVLLTALSLGLVQLTIDVPLALGSLATSALLSVAFVVRQLRCSHPLIDLEPLRNRAFWPALLLATVSMISMFSMSVLLPLYFEGAAGMTALSAGLVILVPVLANAGTTLLGGRIMDKRGEWPLLPLGFGAIALGFIALALAGPTLSIPVVFAAALLMYVAVGFVFSPSQTAGLRTLPPQQNPFGVALMTTVVQIAACVGPSLYIGIMSTGQIAAVAQGASASQAAAEGFSLAMLVASGVAAAGFVLSFLYARAARKRTAERIGHSVPCLALLMEPDPYTMPADSTVSQVMRAFVDLKVSGLPLVDAAGHPVGFVSDGDVMRYLADRHPVVTGAYSLMKAANDQGIDERLRELMLLPARTIATEKLIALDADATLEEACSLLASRRLKKVPVVSEGLVVGTVNRSDVLRYAMDTVLQAAPVR